MSMALVSRVQISTFRTGLIPVYGTALDAERQAVKPSPLYPGDWKQKIHKTLSTQFAKKIS